MSQSLNYEAITISLRRILNGLERQRAIMEATNDVLRDDGARQRPWEIVTLASSIHDIASDLLLAASLVETRVADDNLEAARVVH